MPESSDSPWTVELLRALNLVGGLGFLLAAPIAGSVLASVYISGQLGGSVWPVVLGPILGVAAGLYAAYRALLWALRPKE